MTSLLRTEPTRDIRGQRFDQTSLPTELQGAIAGQHPLHKGLVVVGLGLGCLFTSALIGVLASTLGLEVQSWGQFGNTFYESLATTIILILWLSVVTYQSWERALWVGLVGLGSSIILQGILGQLRAIALVDNYFPRYRDKNGVRITESSTGRGFDKVRGEEVS